MSCDDAKEVPETPEEGEPRRGSRLGVLLVPTHMVFVLLTAAGMGRLGGGRGKEERKDGRKGEIDFVLLKIKRPQVKMPPR